ncbi:extracellular solute-binding protein [Yoonia sp.]|uniref:extracellular solute-binding protein n=1 Tax=Yoonia sp. TaxID=2212373 RepID=UPI00358F8CFA
MLKLTSTALSFLVVASAATAEELRVYNWSDYIDESLLAQFEEETGIDLIYEVYDSNEIMEAKLLAGEPAYDVVVPSGDFLQRQIVAGAFQALDRNALTNSGNIWDLIEQRTAQYDPLNAYSINYMWGTTGIGVNVDQVQDLLGEDAPINSLALIFEVENISRLQECGVQLLNAPSELIPAGLQYLGLNPDSKDADEIRRAGDLLKTISPYVRSFDSSGYIEALAAGELCVAFGWSGDVLQSRDIAYEEEADFEIAYNAPVEGALMWFDQMAIPANSPNPEGAHKFLNFMLDANNMATASNYVYYANGNIASQEFLVEDVITDTAIYPDEETLGKLYTVTPYGPLTLRVVTEVWDEVTSSN